MARRVRQKDVHTVYGIWEDAEAQGLDRVPKRYVQERSGLPKHRLDDAIQGALRAETPKLTTSGLGANAKMGITNDPDQVLVDLASFVQRTFTEAQSAYSRADAAAKWCKANGDRKTAAVLQVYVNGHRRFTEVQEDMVKALYVALGRDESEIDAIIERCKAGVGGRIASDDFDDLLRGL